MKYLKLETRRSGYAPDQLINTMSVRELIELLETYDDDTKVILSNDNGYTYGEVWEKNFEEVDEEEDDD